ncbi:hypothetical protein ABBQ32_002329 [Trebouxia sp. C0010 RCD-2024]
MYKGHMHCLVPQLPVLVQRVVHSKQNALGMLAVWNDVCARQQHSRYKALQNCKHLSDPSCPGSQIPNDEQQSTAFSDMSPSRPRLLATQVAIVDELLARDPNMIQRLWTKSHAVIK